MKKILPNLTLLFISSIIALLILEVILRIFKDEKFYVWNPNLKVTFNPQPKLFPGISGESRFIINSEGFRGDEISGKPDYKIITIGGSTTECIYLDQNETWPELLKKKLNNLLKKNVWVGNAGKSGLTTYDNAIQVKELLKQNPTTDIIITMVGINDFQRRLTLAGDYQRGVINQKTYARAFDRMPGYDPDLPFYERTELWSSFLRIKSFFLKDDNGQDENTTLQQWRWNRKNVQKLLNELPDLSTALNDYEISLKNIISIAGKFKTKIVFVTQPVIWAENLSQELKDLCWFGGIGNYQEQTGHVYYSVDALEKGMELYNERLKKVCEETKTFLIDIAGKLPKDTTVFYDDCHFNESGSKMVADLILKDMDKILKQD